MGSENVNLVLSETQKLVAADRPFWAGHFSYYRTRLCLLHLVLRQGWLPEPHTSSRDTNKVEPHLAEGPALPFSTHQDTVQAVDRAKDSRPSPDHLQILSQTRPKGTQPSLPGQRQKPGGS